MRRLLLLLFALLTMLDLAGCQPWFYARRQHREIEARRAEADADLARSTAAVAERLAEMDLRLREDMEVVMDSLALLGVAVEDLDSTFREHQTLAKDHRDELQMLVYDLEDRAQRIEADQNRQAERLFARMQDLENALETLAEARLPEATPLPVPADERRAGALVGPYVITVGRPVATEEAAEDRAARLRKIINTEFYDAVVVPTGDGRYRAAFGPFTSRIEAEGALQAYRVVAPPGLEEASVASVR